MKTFDYFYRELDPHKGGDIDPDKVIEDFLISQGKKGWELVGVREAPFGATRFYFKREKL